VLTIPGARGPVKMASVLAPFQVRDFAVLDAAFIAVRDGREPVPGRIFLERTKGASKTADAASILLWLAAFAPRMLTMQIAAADESQAGEIHLAAKRILKMPGNEWLAAVLETQAGRIINVRTESTIDVLTADALGSHGAFPSVCVIDEVSHISKWEFVQTLMDNAAKNPFGILLCMTNAGFLDSDAFKLRELARTSPRWYFSQFKDIAPWISEAEIRERQRATSAARFNRLWRGIWCSDAGDALDQADIDAAIVLSGPQGETDPMQQYVAGLDIGTRHDATALIVLSVNATLRRVELAAVESWKARHGREVNLMEVLESIRIIHDRFRPRWYIDPWQGVMLRQMMARYGMPVEDLPFTAANLDRMASAVLNSFSARSIALYDEPQLIADLRSFQLEDRGRTWRLIVKRNEAGHADKGTAFAIALPEAVRLLRRGEYAAPSSAPTPRDDPSRYGSLLNPGSSRYGLHLDTSNQSRGPERWERQPVPTPGNIPIW
jgi:hypothetical protein